MQRTIIKLVIFLYLIDISNKMSNRLAYFLSDNLGRNSKFMILLLILLITFNACEEGKNSTPVCGDSLCSGNEYCYNCPQDCGECQKTYPCMPCEDIPGVDKQTKGNVNGICTGDGSCDGSSYPVNGWIYHIDSDNSDHWNSCSGWEDGTEIECNSNDYPISCVCNQEHGPGELTSEETTPVGVGIVKDIVPEGSYETSYPSIYKDNIIYTIQKEDTAQSIEQEYGLTEFGFTISDLLLLNHHIKDEKELLTPGTEIIIPYNTVPDPLDSIKVRIGNDLMYDKNGNKITDPNRQVREIQFLLDLGSYIKIHEYVETIDEINTVEDWIDLHIHAWNKMLIDADVNIRVELKTILLCIEGHLGNYDPIKDEFYTPYTIGETWGLGGIPGQYALVCEGEAGFCYGDEQKKLPYDPKAIINREKIYLGSDYNPKAPKEFIVANPENHLDITMMHETGHKYFGLVDLYVYVLSLDSGSSNPFEIGKYYEHDIVAYSATGHNEIMSGTVREQFKLKLSDISIYLLEEKINNNYNYEKKFLSEETPERIPAKTTINIKDNSNIISNGNVKLYGSIVSYHEKGYFDPEKIILETDLNNGQFTIIKENVFPEPTGIEYKGRVIYTQINLILIEVYLPERQLTYYWIMDYYKFEMAKHEQGDAAELTLDLNQARFIKNPDGTYEKTEFQLEQEKIYLDEKI
ncbi:LysM peptidoglycan-binding domain-containing protein [Candidatus Woesearchaeota archaeon]|nr:LysM peptidoglycan-binding domain-containing protein [Candidatus Woesearchaeota archaeon]